VQATACEIRVGPVAAPGYSPVGLQVQAILIIQKEEAAVRLLAALPIRYWNGSAAVVVLTTCQSFEMKPNAFRSNPFDAYVFQIFDGCMLSPLYYQDQA
jgi:hypothetical protein